MSSRQDASAILRHKGVPKYKVGEVLDEATREGSWTDYERKIVVTYKHGDYVVRAMPGK